MSETATATIARLHVRGLCRTTGEFCVICETYANARHVAQVLAMRSKSDGPEPAPSDISRRALGHKHVPYADTLTMSCRLPDPQSQTITLEEWRKQQ